MKDNKIYKFFAYISLFLIALIFFAYSVDQNYNYLLNKQIDEEKLFFYEESNQLDLHINEAMIFIHSLRGFVNSQLDDTISNNEFNLFAQETQSYVRYIKNFSIAPNNVQKFVYPLAGNEVTLGHNLEEDPRENVRNDVMAAKNTGNIVISGPYQLRQGNLGMVVRNPIFKDNNYWGLVNVVVDVESIIQDSRNLYINKRIDYKLSSNDNVFYQTADIEKTNIDYIINFADTEWLVQGYINNTLNQDNLDILYKNSILYLLVIGLSSLLIYKVIANNFLLSYRVKGLIYNDALTKLPNRRALDQRINDLISDRIPFGIAFIDLDNFKDINDKLGHSIGDEVLVEITKRIKQPNLYEAFRWGGDEFILLKKKVDRFKMLEITEDVASKILLPIHLSGDIYNINCSAGISFYPEDGISKDEIIKLADATMYISKKNGKSRVMLYTEEIGQQLITDYQVERKLELAIKDKLLEVYYQPQFDFKENKVLSFEALVRWKNEFGEFIPPSLFIPIAEQRNLINKLDEYVLEIVANQLKIWENQGFSMKVAVNISAKHFTTSLVQYMDELLERYELTPQSIELEITETAAISNFEYTKELIEKLNARGINIALDDFGTGFSSLKYLSELKISKLKIDRSFVMKLDEHGKECAIIKSIVDMTSTFGILTIVEGIETVTQLEISKVLGCNAYQGYYLSKPLPADQLGEWLVPQK